MRLTAMRGEGFSAHSVAPPTESLTTNPKMDRGRRLPAFPHDKNTRSDRLWLAGWHSCRDLPTGSDLFLGLRMTAEEAVNAFGPNAPRSADAKCIEIAAEDCFPRDLVRNA